MPIIKAAKKHLRQSKRRKIFNLKRKNKIKDLVKQAKILIAWKKIDEAEKLLPQIYKALDKAAKANTIKKNTASRKKSRIARMIGKKSG